MQTRAKDKENGRLEKFEARVVGIYVRVSSERQEKDGQSLEIQTEKLEKFASLKYPELETELYQDSRSASSGRRPSFQELQREIRKKNIKAVMCVSLDRLFRRNKEALEFLDLVASHDCELVILDAGIDTSTPVGKCFFSICAAFAELEAKTNGARVKRTHQANFLAGRRGPGSRPFGWEVDKDKKLFPVEKEQKFISYCLEERDFGRSWGDLARHASRLGIFGVTGKEFSPQSLQSSILNAARRRETIEKEGENHDR